MAERLSLQSAAAPARGRLPPERALQRAREDLSYQASCRHCPAAFWVTSATPHLGKTRPECWNSDPSGISSAEATGLSLLERASLATSGSCTALPATGLRPKTVCDGMHTGELAAGVYLTEPSAELRVTSPTELRLSFKPGEVKRLAAYAFGSGLRCTGLGSTAITTNTPIDPLAFDVLLRTFLGNRNPVTFFMRIAAEGRSGVRDGAAVWFNRTITASPEPDAPLTVEVEVGHVRSGLSEHCHNPIQSLQLRIDGRPKDNDPCTAVVSIVNYKYTLLKSKSDKWISGTWLGKPPIKVWLATLPEHERAAPTTIPEATPSELEQGFVALRSQLRYWIKVAEQRPPDEREDDRTGPAPEHSQTAVVGIGDERRFHCSGAVIHPRAVLTARHCLPATRVAFGTNMAQPEAVVAVSEARVPPDARLDAALLILREPQPQRARLRFRPRTEPSPPAGEVLLLGYGAQPPLSYGRLRILEVPIEGWGCDGLRAASTGCTPGLEMVLPRLRGLDTCRGDSGGPVIEQAQDEPRILAITSRPIAQHRLLCGDGGVYVRADALAPWLDGELQSLDVPPISARKENPR